MKALCRMRPVTWDAAALLRIARQQDPAIDRATVYRTIALLKNRGLIDELDLMHIEGEKHYYEAKTSRDHCHMACFRCGAVMEYASSTRFRETKDENSEAERFPYPRNPPRSGRAVQEMSSSFEATR